MKIALDVDDVLAQFYPAACKYFGYEEIKTDIWDKNGYASFIADYFNVLLEDADFWTTLKPLSTPESINFDFDYYMTSLPVERIKERERWLITNGYPNKPIVFTQDKVSMCKTLGVQIIIDDKIETINTMNNEGMLGILFKPPYMIDKGEKHITHLSEVLDIINYWKSRDENKEN